MAINTENKRRSALACGLMWLTVFPVADGTITGPDLPHSVAVYASTGYPEPVATVILKFVQGAWSITKSFFFIQGGR